MSENETLPDPRDTALSLAHHSGRSEDVRLLTGSGRFCGNRQPAGTVHAVFVRAPFAAADIKSIDVDDARSLPGVLGVFTADDINRAELGQLRCAVTMPGQRDITRPILAEGSVRHVGEIVAMVVAETVEAAKDSAEAVFVDYETKQSVVSPFDAIQNSARTVHPAAPDNTAYEWDHGTRTDVDRAIQSAAHVVTVSAQSGRIIVNPMETRCALAEYEPEDQSFTLYTPTQGAHKLRDILAEEVFGIEQSQLRVVTEDVGGAFGIKLQAYPEHVLVLFAARELGKPVRWVADRTEGFLADAHGRAQHNTARLALDSEGKFTALSVESLADMGAYLSTFNTSIASAGGTKVLGHTYKIPDMHVAVRGVMTNTPPVDAYRGAGKPEIVFVLERAIEEAAYQLGIDPAELRRRNLLKPSDLPYTMGSGQIIDSGDFPTLFERALHQADWQGFPARRADAEARGLCAGIGVSLHMHASGGFPNELSEIEIASDGRIMVRTGTQSGGQGHETVFAKLVADRLGLNAERVQVTQGDTALLARGGGTGGSSSLPIAAVNLTKAAEILIQRGKDFAAEALETAAADIEYAQGVFTVVGTDRSIGLFSLAAQVPDLAQQMGSPENTLSAGCDFDGPYATFPNGCYVAEVEIDPETGVLTLTRFSGFDDLGVMLSPMIAQGQIHGGVVQGIGQAMTENTVFDPQSGQLLSGSFMDYAVPRAQDLPSLDLGFAPVPAVANPLGVKGAGEVGTIGGPAPVAMAALNALRPLGVSSLDIPLTPLRIWTAIQAAKSASEDAA